MNTSTNNLHQTTSIESMIIKDIVLNNYKAAGVMEKYGIDFCCKGKRPLGEAIKEKRIDAGRFMSELRQTMDETENSGERVENWDLTFLFQYIVNNHHAYVRKSLPLITGHLEKINKVHGAKYHYLYEVLNEFKELADELSGHMQKEERILFPLIKYLVDSEKFNEKPKTDGFGTIKNPIMKMESEHSSAGTALENIRKLTDNFTLPEDACTTFELTYKELQEFEKDLHTHIHLENNILFPKAIMLEEKLLK